jgi:nitrite reductase/ring-hydroxylating ferredoxin subunit
MLERMARTLRGLSDGIAGAVSAVYRALGRPGKLLQDLLNGSWLGHSLHAVLTDVVIGAATAALLLDLARVVLGVEGLELATTWVVGLTGLSAIGAILSGLTDFKDTTPSSALRDLAGLHGIVNVVGTVAFAYSFAARLTGAHDPAFWGLLLGYLVISVGSFIGGHVVFKYGYMVNYNAFPKLRKVKDFTPVLAAGELPEETPTKAKLGATAVVLVRRGDVVHALRDTCAHAGGPLSGGQLRGDAIECPWHSSVYRLADGRVVHGPASTTQPSYEARINEGQVELRGPRD